MVIKWIATAGYLFFLATFAPRAQPYAQTARIGPGAHLTVATDGSGDYRSVQAAFDACSPHTTILVKAGTYREKLHLDSTKDHITLIGETGAVLTFDDHPGMVAPNGDSINTRNSYSFRVSGDDFRAENITIRNDAGFNAGQAVGIEARGDRAVFINCRII